jgi:N-acyl-D-amino-acid deacylase
MRSPRCCERYWPRPGCVVFLCCVLLGISLPSAPVVAEHFDLILANGQVVDGLGGAPQRLDVGVRGDRVAWLGNRTDDSVTADRIIDVSGQIVAPGFIDLHTHARADLLDPEQSAMTHYLTQGVTTLAIGNDGDGAVDIAARGDAVMAQAPGLNVFQYVGHASLRRQVMADVRHEASEDDIRQMQELLRKGLSAGAVGLSSGLFYADGNAATLEEMVALCRVVAEFDGVYDTHMRAESSREPGVLAALDEAIEIGRRTGVRVNISHIKLLGPDVWGQTDAMISRVDAARAAGVRITADQYPWIASSTQFASAILSARFRPEPSERWDDFLADSARRIAVKNEAISGIARRGGADRLMIVESRNPLWNGQLLSDIATAMSTDTASAALAVLMANGATRVVSFNMTEADVEALMVQPWVATSSDGTNGHPRKVASFPRKYAHYVRARQVLSLSEFVASSSQRAAALVGLRDRGLIAVGAIADIVVFDPLQFADRATFADWSRQSAGVNWLLIQGQFAVEAGAISALRSGQVLIPNR